jgi:ribosomal protein S18 acetylase RimI-like enzyme
MAVRKTLRSRGVGRQVLSALISRAEQLGASELYLICNTILAPAIHLYQSVGFTEVALPAGQKYERGNIAFQRSVRNSAASLRE